MPPRVVRALERALSPAPADRFANLAEFVGALEAGAPSEHRAETPRIIGLHDDVEELDDEPPPPAPQRRWVPMGVLGLLVVGGAVATAWLLSSGATMNEAANAPLAPPSFVRDSVVPEVSPLPPPVLPQPVLPERRDSVVRPPSRPRVPLRAKPAARAPSRPPVAAGHLFVNATPWGQVYLDGVLIGNTPRAGVAVAPGAHQLRVARDGFQSFDIAIRIAPGQELRLTDIVLQELKP